MRFVTSCLVYNICVGSGAHRDSPSMHSHSSIQNVPRVSMAPNPARQSHDNLRGSMGSRQGSRSSSLDNPATGQHPYQGVYNTISGTFDPDDQNRINASMGSRQGSRASSLDNPEEAQYPYQAVYNARTGSVNPTYINSENPEQNGPGAYNRGSRESTPHGSRLSLSQRPMRAAAFDNIAMIDDDGNPEASGGGNPWEPPSSRTEGYVTPSNVPDTSV